MKKNTIKKHRQDLAGKRGFTDISQLVMFIIFISIWILDSFFLKNIYFFAINFSFLIRIPIALVVLGLAICLIIRGMQTVFGEIREKPHVITKDVFSIIRHPIYFGAILIYFVLILLTLSILSSIVFILVIILYFGLSLSEEKVLLERFGEEYRKYKQEVPMIIPYKIIFRKKGNDNIQ